MIGRKARKTMLGAGVATALLGAFAVSASAHGPQGMGAGTTAPGYGMPCPGYGMGPGMMGPHMMGPGMMGPGMMGPGMMGPGMGSGMMNQGYGMGPGMMGPGMMGPGMMAPGYGMGPGMMAPDRRMMPGAPGSGGAQQLPQELSIEDVRQMMEQHLAWQSNPNLKLGTVEQAGEDRILAEIVTKDGSLVRRYAVDRRTGWIMPAD